MKGNLLWVVLLRYTAVNDWTKHNLLVWMPESKGIRDILAPPRCVSVLIAHDDTLSPEFCRGELGRWMLLVSWVRLIRHSVVQIAGRYRIYSGLSKSLTVEHLSFLSLKFTSVIRPPRFLAGASDFPFCTGSASSRCLQSFALSRFTYERALGVRRVDRCFFTVERTATV